MEAAWLDWLAPVLEEAQVPLDEESRPVLEPAVRRIAGLGPEASPEEVWRVLDQTWLRLGPPGIQLLGSLIRDAVYSRRDSRLRPEQGGGYFQADVPEEALARR